MPVSGSGQFIDQILLGFALAAVDAARAAVVGLLNAFGSSTEPDFNSIAPVYGRMLAVALLLVGAFIACALVERILGGPLGAGWAVIPRALAAVFCAYAGLEVVQYVAGYAALLATTWSPDMTSIADHLAALANTQVDAQTARHVPLGGVIGLILIALLMDFMAIVVYLELIVRAALTLMLVAFIPLVSAMAIWPRLAGAITHLCEFLVGLLLSKFVIATVTYIGFGLVISGLGGGGSGSGQADWIVTGVAVLCVAAFSPVVMIQGLRFTHATAGTVARGWVGMGVSAGTTTLGMFRSGGAIGRVVGGARRAGTAVLRRGQLKRPRN
ncbi:MAG TPA: hypothetical protein VF157_08630 [Chloroflexota bacterium]